MSNAPLSDGIAKVKAGGKDILPLLEELREFSFFRYFHMDMMTSCAYMPTHEQTCAMETCEISPVDDVPDEMADLDETEHDFELDSWARWDMPSDFTEYYDIVDTAAIDTGYNGSHVWRFIHERIQFQGESLPLWQADFNRAISGLHASVSSHITAAQPDEDAEMSQYRRRLRDIPGAVDGLYFAYMLTLCALHEARETLETRSYLGEDDDLLPIMRALTASPLLEEPALQRAAESLREHARSPQAQLWKCRLRTRDMLRIMNCVDCALCRLHGKVTVLGLGTALRALLGSKGRSMDTFALHRVEVAALVATAGKLGTACANVERWKAADEAAGGA